MKCMNSAVGCATTLLVCAHASSSSCFALNVQMKTRVCPSSHSPVSQFTDISGNLASTEPEVTSMATLVREERYIFTIGTESHVLRVQEMLWDAEPWPHKFRVHLPASHTRRAKDFYGETALIAAELVAEYLTSPTRSELASRVAGMANN